MITAIRMRPIDNGWILRVDYQMSHTEEYYKNLRELWKALNTLLSGEN